MVTTWDTDEVETWFLNDEDMYQAVTFLCLNGPYVNALIGMRELAECIDGVDVDEVDFDHVFDVMLDGSV